MANAVRFVKDTEAAGYWVQPISSDSKIGFIARYDFGDEVEFSVMDMRETREDTHIPATRAGVSEPWFRVNTTPLVNLEEALAVAIQHYGMGVQS